MKDYFFRLIQNTGITFGTGPDAKTGSLEQPSLGMQDERIPPIHVEDRRLIEPPTDQAVKKGDEIVREAPEQSVPVTELGHIQHPAEKSFLSDSPKEKKDDALRRKKTKEQRLGAEEPKLAVFDTDSQTLPEEDSKKDIIVAGKSLRIEETTENDIAVEDHIRYPGDSSVSTRKDFKLGTESNDRITRKQISRAAMKEAREWVAGSPVAGIEEIQNVAESKAKQMREETPSAPAPQAFTRAPHQGLIGPHQGEESEAYDVHLTIGTISVTIEEPKKEIQVFQPPQKKREGEPGRGSISSRLSRHYLRIR